MFSYIQEISSRKCDWCKKDLNTGAMVLKSEVGKEYCSTECLGKWFTTQNKSEQSTTPPVTETSDKPPSLTTSSSSNSNCISSNSTTTMSIISNTSTIPITAVQTDTLQTQTNLQSNPQSNPKIQKLLTLCSSANLLIPFPSICKDFTGKCNFLNLFTLTIKILTVYLHNFSFLSPLLVYIY